MNAQDISTPFAADRRRSPPASCSPSICPCAPATNEPPQRDVTDGKFAPNAFIRIDETGHTILMMPQVEMGQGTYTSISAVLAEELDADWSKVEVQHAPPNDKLYGNPTFGLQVTGNSNSIRAWWMPLRKAGATARAMLVQAAAAQWGVEPASCTASKGEVMHAASGRKLGYGAIALAARDQTPPKDVPVKDPKDFVLIGQPLKRLDTPDKVNGKVVYGIDAILPNMKFATVAACPVFGGKVGKVDDSAAMKVAGVRKIVVLDDMVAVIGDHMRAAKKGLAALKVEWNEGPNAKIGSKEIWQHLRAASAEGRRGRAGPTATSQRPSPAATFSKPAMKCPSSRTRRWSRSTPRCTSSRIPARSGPARRS